MKLHRLKTFSAIALGGINKLLIQLSSSEKKLRAGEFKKLIADENIHLFSLEDKRRIVGMGTLIIMHTVSGKRARIEDVVVDEAYRGRGFGEKLTRALIAFAKNEKAKAIELSSRPSRVAANRLYRRLGFRLKETNSYFLNLK